MDVPSNPVTVFNCPSLEQGIFSTPLSDKPGQCSCQVLLSNSGSGSTRRATGDSALKRWYNFLMGRRKRRFRTSGISRTRIHRLAGICPVIGRNPLHKLYWS